MGARPSTNPPSLADLKPRKPHTIRPFLARLHPRNPLLFAILLLCLIAGYHLPHPLFHHTHPLHTYTKASLTLPSYIPSLPSITLLTSAYHAGYSHARHIELQLVAARNARLLAVSRLHRLVEPGLILPASSSRVSATRVPNANITYEKLFREAQKFSGVVALANADVYFDESLACAAFISPYTVLALSRHPSPDCFIQSSAGDRGNEPPDFCSGYHPTRAASHDVFIFRPPLPEAFLQDLHHLPVNRMGAENVVIHNFQTHGYDVVNPCANIHAFHQHCTGERAPSARYSAPSIANERRQFGATANVGFLHGRLWMDEAFVSDFGDVDCLGFGLMAAERLACNRSSSVDPACARHVPPLLVDSST